MSINKFISVFIKNKPFFWRERIESSGFWVFELLVAIVILMLTTLFLFRFSCNMISLEADSVNRLMAIDYIASHLDSVTTKGLLSEGIEHNFLDKSVVFELSSRVSSINIAKSNMPYLTKSSNGLAKINVLCLSVSYKSAFGKENTVKVFASGPRSGGLS